MKTPYAGYRFIELPTLVIRSIDERYVSIHILPTRIDLIDESRGWGMRETLDV